VFTALQEIESAIRISRDHTQTRQARKAHRDLLHIRDGLKRISSASPNWSDPDTIPEEEWSRRAREKREQRRKELMEKKLKQATQAEASDE